MWNECKAIATRGVHRLVVPSRGCPWLELNVPSVPGRPILGSLSNCARCCHMVPTAPPSTHINCTPATRLVSIDFYARKPCFGDLCGILCVKGALLGLGARSNFVHFRSRVPLGPPSTHINCTAAPACGMGSQTPDFTALFLCHQI